MLRAVGDLARGGGQAGAAMSVWSEMDKAARPIVVRELMRLGWAMHGVGGNHQWTAYRLRGDDSGWSSEATEITTMNPFRLIEKVEAHEARLERKRLQRARGGDFANG